MSAPSATRSQMTHEQMDALVDGHYRAEETGDLASIVAGFRPGAEHDVVGRPGAPLHGGEQIGEFYRALLAELRIDRFQPVHRRYGADFVVDESVLHATATGHPADLTRGRLDRPRCHPGPARLSPRAADRVPPTEPPRADSTPGTSPGDLPGPVPGSGRGGPAATGSNAGRSRSTSRCRSAGSRCTRATWSGGTPAVWSSSRVSTSTRWSV
jgi:hypothetical protein